MHTTRIPPESVLKGVFAKNERGTGLWRIKSAFDCYLSYFNQS